MSNEFDKTVDTLDAAIQYLQSIGYSIQWHNGRYYAKNEKGQVVNPGGLTVASSTS